MVPGTLDRPKPLVRVNGKRIIETLIEVLFGKGIKRWVAIGSNNETRYSQNNLAL